MFTQKLRAQRFTYERCYTIRLEGLTPRRGGCGALGGPSRTGLDRKGAKARSARQSVCKKERDQGFSRLE